MGAGTNFQKHLVALHHLDCPWRPRDIEQREGRILRSGNDNAEVEIFTYVTKGSYDANMWEKVSIKQSMIDAVLRGDPTINELDDISEISASYEDIAPTAYENPLMSEEAKLSAQLRRLRYSKSIFAQQQRQTAAEQKKLTAMIPLGEIGGFDIKLRAEHTLALREVSEKIINDAAKNPDVARAIEQLGAKIVDGKVTYPDDKTFQACVNLVNSGIVKSSQSGNVDTTIKNFVDPQDLNSFQRAFATFAKEMGVPIVFFRGAKNFHGAHANGISFYNADANFSHEWVYWHEFGHWLKNNQPELFGKLSDAANVTDKQIAEKKKSRTELSDEDLREEIIYDAMSDVARRAGIFRQFAKKNQSLIQRLMS